MAAITPNFKDGKIFSYRFRACVGRDKNNRQVFRTMTWKVPRGLTTNKADKAARKAAEEWEQREKEEYEKDILEPERAKAREIANGKTDFVRFTMEEWFPICIDNGEHKPKTIAFYNDTTKNIVEHFKGKTVQTITATDIQKFIIYLLSNRAGMKVSLLYSISAGRSTAKDTEHYLRQVIAASYPSELQRIERLMTLGVLVDD